MLERIRLLDIISYWAKSTHNTYKSKFKVLHDFEDDFDLKILQPTKLSKPPGSPGVPLMWCQEFYSLRKAYDKRDKGNMIPLAYTTIRHLRSAASQYCALDAIVSDPSGAVLTKDQKVLFQRCRPTDSLISSLFAKGMLSRLGDESKPSVALLDCHIRELDRELNAMYYAAESPLEKRDLALAGFANLALWLGWLRSSECFDAEWTDISAVEPHQSARHDLPPDSGWFSFASHRRQNLTVAALPTLSWPTEPVLGSALASGSIAPNAGAFARQDPPSAILTALHGPLSFSGIPTFIPLSTAKGPQATLSLQQ